ncbi:hypothetical protein CDL12_10181 [Handroanthus impetiginosus]|uniref:Uncharacterized protein n=1 Tax=Handroanthus impetiginosus TaxID=429701 RepID=A0A2G9HHY2_9LAMI|nr:hypothetical protein CDL12_10181 [Handroanthus impetiginosus]
MIRESMLIFLEFLGAEKGVQGSNVDLQKTDKLVILVDIITNLQKMDRRIRKQVRSQNCMIKKMQKHDKHVPDHELVASQVVLRLVSRVLNLPRLTKDQLVWCRKKLSNISFVRRRVHVEPSFLLFPC